MISLGRAFNEICLDNYNRPFNPMINMGAIMVTSLIRPDMILADRFDFIRNIMKEFTAGRHVFCDMVQFENKNLLHSAIFYSVEVLYIPILGM